MLDIILSILVFILLVLIVSILPFFLRYVIIKKPVNKGIAFLIVIINAFIMFIVLLYTLDNLGLRINPTWAIGFGNIGVYNLLQE